MKKICLLLILLIPLLTSAQVTLTGTSYSENFDGVGTALPNGWTVRTAGTTSFLGTSQTFLTAPAAWNSTVGAFKNSASSDGLSSSTIATNQNSSTDRVMSVRQTGSFGDPGAAFVLQLNNTTGLSNIVLSFKLQSLLITVLVPRQLLLQQLRQVLQLQVHFPILPSMLH